MDGVDRVILNYLGACDLAATEATCANINMFWCAFYDSFNALNIRLPSTIGSSVRV